MYDLLRKQVILFCSFLISSTALFGQSQMHRPDHDDWSYYFGITLGYNNSHLHATKHPRFLQSDSILSANPLSGGGINLGLHATLRISNYWQFRINPQLMLGGAQSIAYELGAARPGEPLVQKQVLPTTILALPMHFKFNSDRIGNFRAYLLGGVRYHYDMSSNATARNAEDLVKLRASDWGLEAGVGFNFFLPFVTISPEIKFSQGISNIHQRDPALKFSNVLDRIQSRMIFFSIHIED